MTTEKPNGGGFPVGDADNPPREGCTVAGRRFLTLAQVQQELAITASQVYALVRRGDLPAVKLGGRGQWRVERAKLEEYIAGLYIETAEFVRRNPYPGPGEPMPPETADEPEPDAP